ncbi:hypothetical protein WCLE_008560 [Wolbachia endosymbiont of Cimex lectularius]|uniref:Uncharacterized protein n=3 Tax=unclassified Wolbachia TaxID=2640676 RepID=A0A060Q3A8_9RICK|nr:hypothetical protein WCLE_008560 [Wolbachia endosymbiont of Cimex lectularius]BAP01351.1 hypothetical protein [Wolbachia sp. SYDL]BAP01359.1 hypothetical protein [Wolbachia sp. TUA]BAP01367.1 hypothetical protein [Wolbachia sp. TIH]
MTKRAKNRDIFPSSIFYSKPLMLNFINSFGNNGESMTILYCK